MFFENSFFPSREIFLQADELHRYTHAPDNANDFAILIILADPALFLALISNEVTTIMFFMNYSGSGLLPYA